MTIHEVKINTDWYDQAASGRKTCEIRRHDRDYQAGDLIWLREWDGEDYTGRWVQATISHVLAAPQVPCMFDPNHCILSLTDMAEGEREEAAAEQTTTEEDESNTGENLEGEPEATTSEPTEPTEDEHTVEDEQPAQAATEAPAIVDITEKPAAKPTENGKPRVGMVDSNKAFDAVDWMLSHGCSVASISLVSGVSHPTIRKIMDGAKTCHHDVETKLIEGAQKVATGNIA